MSGKGIWMRKLGPALQYVYEHFMNVTNVQHRMARLALQNLNEFEYIVKKYHGANKILAPDVSLLVEKGRNFLKLNTALGQHYHALNIRWFNTTIKYHYLLHLAYRSSYQCPSKGWCYGGESFLKHVRKMVQRQAVGSPPALVGNKSVQCYTQAIHASLAEYCGQQCRLTR